MSDEKAIMNKFLMVASEELKLRLTINSIAVANFV